jgi:hypothetical protein
VPGNVPDQAGPVPDRVSIWPMEDGSYGLDVTYQGASGFERAEQLQAQLDSSGVKYSLRQELGDGWSVRLSPLTKVEVSKALEALLQ